MKQETKELWKKLFTLGGVYSVISLLFALFSSYVLNGLIFFLFVVSVIVLCVRKEFPFLELADEHPAIKIYLQCLGASVYLGLALFCVPAFIVGFQSARAQNMGIEYASPWLTYLSYVDAVSLVLMIAALIVAVHLDIRRRNSEK